VLEIAPFLDAIALAEAPLRRFSQPWNRQALLAEFGSCCAFCSRPLEGASGRAWLAVALVPPQLGGPVTMVENWVPSCRRCATARGLRDVVGWTEWRGKAAPDRVAALLERRRSALLYAENHFTPLSRHAQRERVLVHLASRFDKPRFRVHAWSGVVDGECVCLVGWSTRAGDPQAIGEALLALRLRDGAEVLAEGRTHLLRLPADGFLGAVWTQIEAHGIVLPLGLPGGSPLNMNDWRECWRHRVHDPVSNHKRVPMSGGQALPHAPSVLSTKPDSVRRLAQLQASRREGRLAEAQLHYREALARKARYLERVRRGSEASMALEAYRAWSDEVRQLGVAWARLESENRRITESSVGSN